MTSVTIKLQSSYKTRHTYESDKLPFFNDNVLKDGVDCCMSGVLKVGDDTSETDPERDKVALVMVGGEYVNKLVNESKTSASRLQTI